MGVLVLIFGGKGEIEGGNRYTYIPGYCEWSVDGDDLVLSWGVDGEGIWGGVGAAWCLIAG